MDDLRPYQLCQLARKDGRVVYCVRSSHATERAALSAAATRSAFAPGWYRVRDARDGRWLSEIVATR
jgi:hypothetical protein